MEEEIQICVKCNIEQPITNFGRYKDNRKSQQIFRRRKSCNKCRRKYQNIRYENNPEVKEKMKINAHIHRIEKFYKISYEEYKILKEDTNNICNICKIKVDKTLNLDHCHKTGKIRGFLCWSCNIGLGKFRDNIGYLTNAIEYLRKNT